MASRAMRRTRRAYGADERASDTRLHVRHRQQGWFGRLEKNIGADCWTVQRDGYEYYLVCKYDDLETIE